MLLHHDNTQYVTRHASQVDWWCILLVSYSRNQLAGLMTSDGDESLQTRCRHLPLMNVPTHHITHWRSAANVSISSPFHAVNSPFQLINVWINCLCSCEISINYHNVTLSTTVCRRRFTNQPVLRQHRPPSELATATFCSIRASTI